MNSAYREREWGNSINLSWYPLTLIRVYALHNCGLVVTAITASVQIFTISSPAVS